MSEIKITLTRLASPQVGPFVLAAYLDLVNKNLHDGRFDLKPDKHVLLIEKSDNGRDWEYASVAMFMISAEQRVLWVDLLYVREEFRGCGFCRKMIGVLLDIGRQNEALELQFSTSVANAAMRGAAKKIGCTEKAIVISMPISAE